MIDKNIRSHMASNFIETHKKLLLQKYDGDESMYNQNFANRKVRDLYTKIITTYLVSVYKFYEQYPNGNYDSELKFVENQKLLDMVDQYFELTQDGTFYKLLKVFVYCIEELNYKIIGVDGKVDKQKVINLFKDSSRFSLVMYDRVSEDIDAKNYWWLKETATSLRRQLREKSIFISTRRLQRMFDKFFPRHFNATKIKEVNNIELVQELDIAMLKKYHTYPYYFWWADDNTGKKVLMMDKLPPKNGKYSFIVYQNQTSKEVKDEDKGYYL